MIKTSTNYDMVKYVYNELEENKKTKFKINTYLDPSLEKEVEAFFEVKEALESYFEKPSEVVISKIKDYSLMK